MRLDFLHFFFGSADDVLLLRRHQHVIHANRHATARSVGKAGIHQLVGKNHRLAQTATTEAGVDELGNFFFLEDLVNVGKRQANRQNFR